MVASAMPTHEMHQTHQKHHTAPCDQCDKSHTETAAFLFPAVTKIIVTPVAFFVPSYSFSLETVTKVTQVKIPPPEPSRSFIGTVIIRT